MTDVTDYIAEWKKSKEFTYGYTHDFRDLNTIANAQYPKSCLLYTSDAADERSSVDLGGRRIIKKKKKIT